MRIHRVHVPGLSPGTATLLGAEAHHLRNVLRVRPGQEVRAFDGGGSEAAATVVALDAGVVTLEVGPLERGATEAPVALTLAVPLLKGDKLAEVVRKGTELGAVRFRLFACRRSEVPALSTAKLGRYRRVAAEAAKQSRRAVVPELVEPVALAALPIEEPALVAAPVACVSVRQALAPQRPPALTLVTGPEGGLERVELDALTERGARTVRLGPRVLRAETAPVALAAAVLLPDAL